MRWDPTARLLLDSGVHARRIGDTVVLEADASLDRLAIPADAWDASELAHAGVAATRLEQLFGGDLHRLIESRFLQSAVGGPASPLRLKRTKQPIGFPLDLDAPHPESSAASWVVVGAPIDTGGPDAVGARRGPPLIRRESSLARLRGLDPADIDSARILDFDRGHSLAVKDLSVFDAGDLRPAPGESMDSYGRRLSTCVDAIVRRGGRPVVLGGDQSISWPVIRGLLSSGSRLGVVHFDAHHDLSHHLSELHHGNPFRFALAQPELVHLHQVGLRTTEVVGTSDLTDLGGRITYDSVASVARRSPEELFGHLRRDIPYYLSFDVDCLDPSIAPETGSPEPGGLTFSRCAELLDALCDMLDFVGADFVEVVDRFTQYNAAARCCARLLDRFLLGQVKDRGRLERYYVPTVID